MLFNSLEFIVFLVLVYALYLALPFRFQNHMLLVTSYIFYGWWDVRFLFLVAISTTVDFWVGLLIENGRLSRRQLIGPTIFLALSALAFLCLKLDVLWTRGPQPLEFGALVRWSVIPWVLLGTLLFAAAVGVVTLVLQLLRGPQRRLF